MKDILSEIIAHKQTEIELQKQTVSLEQLQEQAGARKKPKRNAWPKNSVRKNRLSAIRWPVLSEWEARKVTAKAMPHPEQETRVVRSEIPIMELTKV